jgi:hypothetical protein
VVDELDDGDCVMVDFEELEVLSLVGTGPVTVVDELDDEGCVMVDVEELEVAVVDSSADSWPSESGSTPSSTAPSARPGPNGLAVTAGSPVFTGVLPGGAVSVG